MDLLQCGQDVPVGPGPSLAAGDAVIAGGDVITLVRGGAVGGMTSPGGGGGLSPKYDGGGAGLRADCSYGGGSPILFSTKKLHRFKCINSIYTILRTSFLLGIYILLHLVTHVCYFMNQ